jgi:spore coat polysaccharide biosynthesis predicted glycosyltransferase SpsG
MRLVFLADASQISGTGHVMRCLAIAEEAISQGIECHLVGNIEGVEWLSQRVQSLGIIHIKNPYKFKSFKASDILVIDSYLIQGDEPFLTQQKWKKVIVVIDQKTPFFDADLYIHPGLDSHWYKGDPKKILTGPLYIPFRKSIQTIDRNLTGAVKNITVFGGGTDAYNFAIEIASILKEFNNFQKVIFFSSMQSDIEKIDSRFKVLPFGTKLDNEITLSDLVLTTASVSSLEILARGLPLGIVCAVDNQLSNYHALGYMGVAAQIGERISSRSWQFDILTIAELINNANFRDKLTRNSHKVLDLQGARRIIEEIKKLIN